ncbi:unnamed protein product [Linum tenue]|uniref:Uncharacterized protein n=1 Tax=Linum tenue TaxID=586396 RepID=A0AAV0M9E1_9ROSI|nr:unnamed protein product [Linum tenue]
MFRRRGSNSVCYLCSLFYTTRSSTAEKPYMYYLQ